MIDLGEQTSEIEAFLTESLALHLLTLEDIGRIALRRWPTSSSSASTSALHSREA